ncbi:MAG TPA: protein kinase [Candidatus Egerieimonas faecigallinarum]|nr:protein kinase [Candidatus Egerieimonas faecigallinarum]
MEKSSQGNPADDILGKYLDLDFLDRLAPPKKKSDGRFYSTYIADMLPEIASLVPDSRTIVIKELPPEQAKVYHDLSTIWSPYLEAVFGVVDAGDISYSVSEFIEKPSCLTYPQSELHQKRMLSLEDYITHYGCFNEKEALIFLAQLCEGLETLSQFHYVHGDISPQNILLTDALSCCPSPAYHVPGLHQKIAVKIIDFDITKPKKEANHLVTYIAGTDPFAAPEILDFREPTGRSDIYSLGCLLSYMLTGKSPKQEKKSVLDAQYSYPVRRIIERCTASYDLRFRTPAELRRHLLNLVSRAPITLSWIVSSIPGFRSHTPWKAGIAGLFYSFFFLMAVLRFQEMPVDTVLVMMWVSLSVLLFFDVFHFDLLSPAYIRLREMHPLVRIPVRLLFGIVFPFLVFSITTYFLEG